MEVKLDSSVSAYVLLLGGTHPTEPNIIFVDNSQSVLNFAKPEVEVCYLTSELMPVEGGESR